ncbi:ML domain-domain-containing protein [Coniella lustricola]|uniref:Phosphatidylglycerol/phosphatidylinositol transfer protein n=1 Tax=Coniella lustricola TaxID=2025994 RepID=A0A2T3AKB5_9PEZI|nr:ML domain-domain-containing protein [Coniella lustricola]
MAEMKEGIPASPISQQPHCEGRSADIYDHPHGIRFADYDPSILHLIDRAKPIETYDPRTIFAMRLSAVLVALTAGVAHAGFGLSFGSSETALDGNLKIPGDSPLELCHKSHEKDTIEISRVDLVPNPPQAGKELVIKASGTVFEDIEEGAYVELQVKYGLIRLISTRADLCEQIKNVGMECPIKKGPMTLTKAVELPKEIPNGKYTVLADVFTFDDQPITCLTATVVFSSSKVEIEL